MADRDIVGDAVRGVAEAPRKYIEEKREAAGRAIESAKKTVRDTVRKYGRTAVGPAIGGAVDSARRAYQKYQSSRSKKSSSGRKPSGR